MNPRLSKTELSQTHLSEEAIQDLLIGAGTPQAEAHIAACDHCRGRIAAFRSDMDLFNQSSLAWAESKSAPEASIANIRQHPKSRPAPTRLLTWKPLTAAIAALLVAAGTLWNYQHTPATSAANGSAQINDLVDSPDQIAEDNLLLRNVYNALDEEPQAPPVDEFSATGTDRPSRTSTKARTQ